MKYYIASKISENISETPEGYLICIGVSIARTGDQVYGPKETPVEPGADGKVIISRAEEEVFRPETIASFEGKPLTIKHPVDFVEPDNWKELAKGVIQNVRRGSGDQKDDLIADILVTDADAIKLVKSGVRELSCGYEAEYVQLEPGKGKQTQIIGNHLALVEEGRAGPSYAINDHKGDTKGAQIMDKKKSYKEKLAAMFAKFSDEAVKTVDAEMPEEKEKAKDDGAYDELVQICKDLSEKITAMGKSKDAEKPAPEEKSKDDDAEEKEKPKDDAAGSVEERLAKVEAMLSKLMEMESAEAGDDDGEEEEATDEEEKGSMVGDTAARAEILAPGIKITKDVKARALKQAYGTKEGKAIIEALNGGKAPVYDSAGKVEMLFVAASEVLKSSRTNDLSKTKQKSTDSVEAGSSDMTAEKMNELNAKHYASK